jgi:hypothetical protein
MTTRKKLTKEQHDRAMQKQRDRRAKARAAAGKTQKLNLARAAQRKGVTVVTTRKRAKKLAAAGAAEATTARRVAYKLVNGVPKRLKVGMAGHRIAEVLRHAGSATQDEIISALPASMKRNTVRASLQYLRIAGDVQTVPA